MVLKKLSKVFAATASVAMMASPMMAMATNSPALGSVEGYEAAGIIETETDNSGNLTHIEFANSNATTVVVMEYKGALVPFAFENGEWNSNYSTQTNGGAITPYEDEATGGEFLVSGGIVMTWISGMVTDGSGTGGYYVANGEIQKNAGFTPYEGCWFVLKNGQVDKSFTGAKTFVDGEGREVTALFAAGRQITEFTGITDDGQGNSYLVVSGVIRTDVNGTHTVSVDGSEANVATFTFENGRVVR